MKVSPAMKPCSPTRSLTANAANCAVSGQRQSTPCPLTTIRSLDSTKMLRKIRQAAGILLLLLFALLAVDFVQAHLRLASVSIEGQFDKDKVIANGEDSIILTLRVTENGRPRVNDTLQAWLQPGNGLMIPEWSYTDENGEVQITFSPNPANPYDLKADSIINVIDINIGRWLEVDKRFSIEIPVEIPLSSD